MVDWLRNRQFSTTCLFGDHELTPLCSETDKTQLLRWDRGILNGSCGMGRCYLVRDFSGAGYILILRFEEDPHFFS